MLLNTIPYSSLASADPSCVNLPPCVSSPIISNMIERISEFLHASEGKLVVFLDSRATLATLRQSFPDAAILANSTPFSERASALQRFQTDPTCRLLLAHLDVASTGVDLSIASQAFFDLKYPHDPAVILQANARIERVAEMFPA